MSDNVDPERPGPPAERSTDVGRAETSLSKRAKKRARQKLRAAERAASTEGVATDDDDDADDPPGPSAAAATPTAATPTAAPSSPASAPPPRVRPTTLVPVLAPIVDEPAAPSPAAPAPAAPSPAASPPVEPPAGKSIAPQPSAYDRALAAYHHGAHLEALALFEKAVADDGDNHLARSYWGLLLVLERGQQKRGQEAADEAILRAPEEVVVYLNAARIWMRLEQKSRAIDVLRAGMQRLPEHPDMRDLLTQLGVRRTPPLKFLPRSHPVNKWVGIAMYRWLKLR